MTEEQIQKIMLIDAIKGRGILNYDEANFFTKLNLAVQCGNQWNDYYEFNRQELNKRTIEELTAIYTHNGYPENKP